MWSQNSTQDGARFFGFFGLIYIDLLSNKIPSHLPKNGLRCVKP